MHIGQGLHCSCGAEKVEVGNLATAPAAMETHLRGNSSAKMRCYWVIPCQFCTFLPDQFFLALFGLNHVSLIPSDAFRPNLATSNHFKGLFQPWVDSGVFLEPKFQLRLWDYFANFFSFILHLDGLKLSKIAKKGKKLV